MKFTRKTQNVLNTLKQLHPIRLEYNIRTKKITRDVTKTFQTHEDALNYLKNEKGVVYYKIKYKKSGYSYLPISKTIGNLGK